MKRTGRVRMNRSSISNVQALTRRLKIAGIRKARRWDGSQVRFRAWRLKTLQSMHETLPSAAPVHHGSISVYLRATQFCISRAASCRIATTQRSRLKAGGDYRLAGCDARARLRHSARVAYPQSACHQGVCTAERVHPERKHLQSCTQSLGSADKRARTRSNGERPCSGQVDTSHLRSAP